MRARTLLALIASCGMLALPSTAAAATVVEFSCITHQQTFSPTSTWGPWECSTRADRWPSYRGGSVTLHAGTACSGGVCSSVFHAWRWSGSSWQRVDLSRYGIVGRMSFHHHPYTRGWSWIGTSATGWLAYPSSMVTIRIPTSNPPLHSIQRLRCYDSTPDPGMTMIGVIPSWTCDYRGLA